MLSDDDSIGFGAPKGTFEIYRAEGESLFKNGMYRKAITSITMALDQKSGHKDCLVLRSKCYLELGELSPALKDANATLKNSSKYHKGLYQKAEVLYTMGDFEQALIYYHRGNNLRPEIQDFRKGIQKAEEAIDNAVGDPGKVKLTKEGDLSFFDQQQTQSGRFGGGPRSAKSAKRQKTPAKKQEKNKKQEEKEAQDMKRLLGDLYGDKVYLEELLKEAENAGKSNEDVSGLAKDGLNYLERRADFWRQQLPAPRKRKTPVHSRKGSAKSTSSAMANSEPGKYVVKQLDLIDKEQAEGKFKESIKRCKKCMEKVNSYPEGTITNRPDVIAHLNAALGNAYLETGDNSKALDYFTTDYEIAEQQNNKEAKARALSNLGRLHSRQQNYNKAISSWEDALRVCEDNTLDVMWLQHEIGRCHLELERYEEARKCGSVSLEAAKEAGDTMWQVNALVLVAQSCVKLQDNAEALDSFEQALELANSQKDRPAMDAINTAIRDVKKRMLAEEGKEGSGKEQEEQNIKIPDEKGDSDEGSTAGGYDVSATPAPNDDAPDENTTEGKEQ